MASSKRLNILVGLKGDKKAKKGLDSVGGSIGALGKKVVALGAVYFGARGLISALKENIRLAGIQEVAERKLSSVYEGSTKSLRAYARELQRTSIFGDEVIIEAQALIGAFVSEEEAIKKATKASLELATAKGMDLVVASDLVSKTLGSSTNALSRYGIEVTGAVGSSERLESLLDGINSKFGGMTEAVAKTTSGRLTQIKNEFSDLRESLGTGFLAKMESTINNVNDELLQLGDIGWDSVAKTMLDSWQEILSAMARITARSTAILVGEMRIAFDDMMDEIFGDTILGKLANLLGDTGEEFAEGVREGNKVHAKAIEDIYSETMDNIKTKSAELADSKALKDLGESEGTKLQLRNLTSQIKLQGKLNEKVVEQGEVIDKNKNKEKERFHTSIGSIRAEIKAYLAQAIAGMIRIEVGTKGLLGLATATAGAVLVNELFEKLVPSFHTGGMIGGSGEQPIMAQSGEFVMRREAVQSIGANNLEAMNSGQSPITINIQGGVVDEDYIRNQLVPAINRSGVTVA